MNSVTHPFSPKACSRRCLPVPWRGLGWAVLAGLAVGLLFAAVDLAFASPGLPQASAVGWEMAKGLAVALTVWLLLHLRTSSRLARAEARLRRLAQPGEEMPRPHRRDPVERLEAGTLHSLRRLQGRAVRATAQLEMIDALVEAAPDGILVIRADQTIARVNRSCARLFGYLPQDLIDRPLDMLLMERQQEQHGLHVERFAADPGASSEMTPDRVVLGRRRNGTAFPIAASIGKASLRGETFLLAIIRDLSALEKARLSAEAAAEKALAAAQKAALADRSKTEFLANMSHELRTPLNGIIGFAEMMQLETFGPLGHSKYQEYVADIQSAGGHLLSILSDILDVSRLDLDREAALTTQTNLSPIVQSVIRSFRERLPGGITIDVDGFERSVTVLANERAARQVLLNLIANASRFIAPEGGLIAVEAITGAPPGRPAAAADPEPAQAGGETGADIRPVRGFRVRDNGPGFSETVLQRFGTPFNTDGDSQVSHAGSGTGLGLYICNRIMSGLQGSVAVHNDGGAVVTVLFATAENGAGVPDTG